MPDGKTHAIATIAATIATPIIVHELGISPTTANTTAVTAGCFMGLLLTPDLDVNHGCQSIQLIRDRIGKGAADVWQMIWMPYAVLIPHRSWLSHFPIAGTTFRLGYLYLVYFCIYLVVAATGSVPMPHIHLNGEILRNSNLIWAFAGLSFADTIHFFMDHLFKN